MAKSKSRVCIKFVLAAEAFSTHSLCALTGTLSLVACFKRTLDEVNEYSGRLAIVNADKQA